MQVAYYEEFGGLEVLKVGELPKPEPRDNEALIAVRASALNPVDYRIRKGEVKWAVKRQFPRIPGNDFAGEVVESNIKGMRNGQQVFGFLDSLPRGGSHANFAVAKPHHLAPKPNNLIFEEAAALPLVSLTAFRGLRDLAHLKPGHKVLINGCCGGVGSMAVQYANHLGAHVTGVCSSPKVSLANDLGCKRVIDYRKKEISGKYHIIFDTVGNLRFVKMKKYLEKGGIMLNINLRPKDLFTMFWSTFAGKQYKIFLARPNANDFIYLKALAEKGVMNPVIDRQFPLEKLRDAYAYLEEGHAAGKVIIT